MPDPLDIALEKLTKIQRQAVEWDAGPLLVLAGPGSGKTQVLTCRIARLLDASRDKNFKVLALTFTNKAADEMKGRVATFVPGLEERANIGTFHSFCAQVLRQHGVHIGINPDFTIYSRDEDRRAVLEDALASYAATTQGLSVNDARCLSVIDRMKARLITPTDAVAALVQSQDRERIAAVYTLYENELRRLNAVDFNSLILETHRLLTTFPAIAVQYRRSHPYWLIDEFQDTNNAQYRFVQALAGASFRNVFAVADDDQIIYQWNGASFRQIQSFLSDFPTQLIQLPTNFRCPPAIVDAANRLVVYNAQRTEKKKPLIAGKTDLKYPAEDHLQLRTFPTSEEEAAGIAEEIADRDRATWGQIAVLARMRALLEEMHAALRNRGVPSVIAQRRDDFLSPEFRWLVAALRQITHPLDRRNLAILVDAFNRIANTVIALDQVTADAEATGRSYMTTWLDTTRQEKPAAAHTALLDLLVPIVHDRSTTRTQLDHLLTELARRKAERDDSDLGEDMAAWRELSRDIAAHIGESAPLDQFLQELQLRSKEPTPKPQTVTLMTIHGAKGREFDFVYVIGLAEDVMPSFQSKKKGDHSPEMEEERRNCFVAITRTRECLVLSRAETYRGWSKEPSRFLTEMQLAD